MKHVAQNYHNISICGLSRKKLFNPIAFRMAKTPWSLGHLSAIGLKCFTYTVAVLFCSSFLLSLKCHVLLLNISIHVETSLFAHVYIDCYYGIKDL